MSMETYHGHVKSAMDAIILFEACRLGTLPRVQRRLTEKERLSIRSGSVFVWDEREAGMRRWTDGKSWSASRVSGSFLTYREMEGRREGGEVYHVSAGQPEPVSRDPVEQQDGSNPNSRDPSPDSIQLITTPEGYRYKPDGLMKQSFSITTSTDLRLHLISYFNRSATEDGLLQPCEDEKLKKIKIPPGLYPDASALIDLYNNPKGKGMAMTGVANGNPAPMANPGPGVPAPGPNPGPGAHGHPGHGHPGHVQPGHVQGPNPTHGPNPAHVHPHAHQHHPQHPLGHMQQPFGPPQHHPGQYFQPNPNHPGPPGPPGPTPGPHMAPGYPYYHPSQMAPPGYYPPGPNGYAGHPGHVQGPPHVNGHPGHPGHPQGPHMNGHMSSPRMTQQPSTPGHPTPPSTHVSIKQEHVIPSPAIPSPAHVHSAQVSHNPSPVTTPQLSSTPKLNTRVSPKRDHHSPALSNHSPREAGHVKLSPRETHVKSSPRIAHVKSSPRNGHVRTSSTGHVSPISHPSPHLMARADPSPRLSQVPRSSLKRPGSPDLGHRAKEVKLELPSVASLLKAQDIPYEKVQWGEDTRAIQALDKGFL